MSAANLPAPENGFLYNFRYCAVLLGATEDGRIRADVYNSIGLSTCPQDQWDALDAEAITQVYELEPPDGTRYMMQSFSRVIDKDLQLEDLQALGGRLDLPPGWSFSVRILDADFALATVDGVAEVAIDDLNNTYQRVP